jgi:type IV secretion system protein VirD4
MRWLWALAIRLLLALAVAVLLFDAVVVGIIYWEYGLIVLAGIVWRICQKRWQASGNYGSARVSGWRDLMRGRLLSDRGLILGRLGGMPAVSRGQALRSLMLPGLPSEWAVRQFFATFLGSRQPGEFIRINDFIHLATFAPAGGGKSVSVLYPNLLSYEGNCVVIDPKGELFAQTAAHRQNRFGHTIVRLDPARLFGPGGDSFNPFDWVNPQSPEFIEVCRDMANMLVVRTGKELDPHWCDSAENVIATFIAYVCALEGNPEARNLRGMRSHLASRAAYERDIGIMQQNEGFYGVLQQMGQSLSWLIEKELGSVMSHAQRFTNIFDAPLVAASTSSTSFDPMELRAGRMTVYLITPPDKLVAWAGLQRLWLGCLLRIITRGVATERNPVLFLVDECAHIGRMQALEDAVTLMRGMGIRLWLFFQSLEQLKKCFGDNAGTVLDNLATQQYFAITSYETAEAMSKRIGEGTILIRTSGDNQGRSTPSGGDGKNPGSINSGSSTNYSEAARKLLKPEEILVLPEDTAIVFHKNHYVIMCQKIRYYADKAFRPRGLSRQWGTGRTRGLGLGSMLLGLAAVLFSLVVTLFLDRLPMPDRQPRTRGGASGYSRDGYGYDVAPSSYGPSRRANRR